MRACKRPSTKFRPLPFFLTTVLLQLELGMALIIFGGELDLGAHPSINAILAVRSSRTTAAARARGKLGARARVGRAVMRGGMGIRGLRMGRRGWEGHWGLGRLVIDLRRRIRGELWMESLWGCVKGGGWMRKTGANGRLGDNIVMLC